jgi:hypothetical protein
MTDTNTQNFGYNGQNLAGRLVFKQTYMKAKKVNTINLINLFFDNMNKQRCYLDLSTLVYIKLRWVQLCIFREVVALRKCYS